MITPNTAPVQTTVSTATDSPSGRVSTANGVYVPAMKMKIIE